MSKKLAKKAAHLFHQFLFFLGSPFVYLFPRLPAYFLLYPVKILRKQLGLD